jgi:hypothetical protein
MNTVIAPNRGLITTSGPLTHPAVDLGRLRSAR